MKYDPSLIKKEYVIVGGKKIPLYKCPEGMQGKNPIRDYEPLNTRKSEDYNDNSGLSKELEEYLNEGIAPDSDEVREIKNKIEKEYLEDFLDPFLEEDVEK